MIDLEMMKPVKTEIEMVLLEFDWVPLDHGQNFDSQLRQKVKSLYLQRSLMKAAEIEAELVVVVVVVVAVAVVERLKQSWLDLLWFQLEAMRLILFPRTTFLTLKLWVL